MKYLEIEPFAENDYNVVIEIPFGTSVKYEIDEKYGDRVRAVREVALPYVFNYGIIPQTLYADGDAADAIVLGVKPILPGTIVKCKLIGVIKTDDHGFADDKFLFVPEYTTHTAKQVEALVKGAHKFLRKYKGKDQCNTIVDKPILGNEGTKTAADYIKDAHDNYFAGCVNKTREPLVIEVPAKVEVKVEVKEVKETKEAGINLL